MHAASVGPLTSRPCRGTGKVLTAALSLTILPCDRRISRTWSPRYAEKDHKHLVELRSRRDALQKKLADRDQAQVDGEQVQVQAEVHQEETSAVLEEGIDF